jgi:hypothetical protein
MEKKCPKCQVVKSLNEFFVRNGRIDSWCKRCVLNANIKNRQNNTVKNTDEQIKEIENSSLTKKCGTCGIIKPIKEFHVRRSSGDAHDIYCIDCDVKRKREKYKNHNELSPEEYKEWRIKENKIRKSEKVRLKTEVLSHYCPDGIIKCLNPYNIHPEEITDLDILTLDHINGDGYKDRGEDGRRKSGGIMFYRKLKQGKYPSGLQVLCYNCQIKKKVLNNEYGRRFGK